MICPDYSAEPAEEMSPRDVILLETMGLTAAEPTLLPPASKPQHKHSRSVHWREMEHTAQAVPSYATLPRSHSCNNGKLARPSRLSVDELELKKKRRKTRRPRSQTQERGHYQYSWEMYYRCWSMWYKRVTKSRPQISERLEPLVISLPLTPDSEYRRYHLREPMKELLKSERDYIDDLRRCLQVYIKGYHDAGPSCPPTLRGKDRIVFGNIEELYKFHSE